MKRLTSLFLLFVGLLYFTPVPLLRAQFAAQRSQAPQSETVYITKTGKRYHRAGCRYLSHSSIKTTLKEAKANGYTLVRFVIRRSRSPLSGWKSFAFISEPRQDSTSAHTISANNRLWTARDHSHGSDGFSRAFIHLYRSDVAA